MATTQTDIGQVVDGNTRFAFDFHGQFRVNAGNIFFSPYSLSAAFAMISAGAVGATAGQIADVLHFALPRDKIHPAFHALIDEIGGGRPGVPDGSVAGSGPAEVRQATLLMVNALWGQNGGDSKRLSSNSPGPTTVQASAKLTSTTPSSPARRSISGSESRPWTRSAT